MRNKTFSKTTLHLFIIGLVLNIFLVWLTGVLKIPLYLDSIGTVLVAVLGGVLPGIAVGFLSNCITALFSVSSDPMTLYYGFLSVLIAVAAVWLSHKGLLRKWYGCVLAVLIFAVIGGALGSVMTWTLYGFSFGQGISAPLAKMFFNQLHMAEFPAQFASAMIIDLADKAITVLATYLTLTMLSDEVKDRLPLGYIYHDMKTPLTIAQLRERSPCQLNQEHTYRMHSIRTKITLLIIASTTVLSFIALTIGVSTYRNKLIEQYSNMCEDAVGMMLAKLDGDRINEYLAQDGSESDYLLVESNLNDILSNARRIKYMYVYSICQDGCHVVFDLDTEDLAGEPVGTVIDFDDSFQYLPQALAGEDIPPFITNDTYGWLLTVYKPIYNSQHNVVAYAAADIDMQEINTDLYSFAICIASLLFGVMIVIAAISLWFCDKKLLEPIGTLVEQARNIDFSGNKKGARVRDHVSVKTGDEIEEVFSAMCRTEDAIAEHMANLAAKNQEISLMQRNIIYTLANMVENRDSNTGGHIKRTASYVQAIGKQLLKDGVYTETVDEEYIKKLYDSAPLHDIGKVKIPDAVLNKPGRLTNDEFSLMKTHTTEGANILKSSLSDIEDASWLTMAIDMAAHHHERWDGKGYPNGLSGEDIPLCARIMAVSDVFDALISKRCYKAAFSFDEAIKIIKDGATNGQFDPNVVAAFLASKDAIIGIIRSDNGT